MSLRNRFSQFAVLAFVGLALAACANQKEPAAAAISSIDAAISTASAEASKYVPDQLADVQSKFAALKDSFSKQDYKAVLAGAPAVLTAAQGLVTAATVKKDEVMKALNGDWTTLAASLPNLVAAVKSRVDILSKSKSKKLPAGVDLTAAKADLEEATTLWTKATGAFSSGNVEEAVNTAKEVKAKAEAAAAALKLDLTAPAPAAK